MNIQINENNITELTELDKTFIGTEKYLGLAYFWNYEYRHYLRSASTKNTVKVHKAFLKAGLEICGESEKHENIIKKILKIGAKNE